MGMSKFFVWGEGVWREMDTSSGRVVGWRRRARFVFVRRGRLHVARRRAVLRALQALAEGAPGAAADGPRLSHRSKTEVKSKLAALPAPPAPVTPVPPVSCAHHHCCAHFNGNISTLAVAPVLAHTSLSGAVPSLPGCPRSEVATQCVTDVATSTRYTINLHARARHEPDSSDDFQTPNRRSSNRTEIDKLLGKQKPGPTNNAKPPKRTSEEDAVELLGKHAAGDAGDKKECSTDDDRRSSGSRNSVSCKELIVSESDVSVLRGFVARTRPDALGRFDADEGYRRALFYAINPLVELRRCRRLERALSERHASALPGFAARLGLAPRAPQPRRPQRPRRHSDGDKENKEEPHASSRKRAQRRDKPNIAEGRAERPQTKNYEERPRTKPDIAEHKPVRLRNKPNYDKRQRTKPRDAFNDDKERAAQHQRALADVSSELFRSKPLVDEDTSSGDQSDDYRPLHHTKQIDHEDISERHRTKSKADKGIPERQPTNPNEEKPEPRNTRASSGLSAPRGGNTEPSRSARASRALPNGDVSQPGTSKDSTASNSRTVRSDAGKADRHASDEADSSDSGAPPAKRARVVPVHSISKRALVASAKEYSNLEDHAIVAWVSGGARASLVNGNKLWQDLQDVYAGLTGCKRSWHSLRNRYLRYILPSLGALMLPHDQQARLRAAARTGCLKKKRNSAAAATARRNSMFAEVSRAGASSRRRALPETRDDDTDAEAPPAPRSLRPRTPGSARSPRSAATRSRSARSPRYSSLTRRFAARHMASDTSSPLPSPPHPDPPRSPAKEGGSRKLYNHQV